MFYFGGVDTEIAEEDRILTLGELGMIKRKIIVVSENILSLDNFVDGSIFFILPLKSTFWDQSTTILLYSTEFLFYKLYTKYNLNGGIKGKIGNIIRVHTQMYHKFINNIVSSAFKTSVDVKYRWITECPMAHMILLNYLMAYFFLSWTEFNTKGQHLNCPIQKILSYEIFMANSAVYNFLMSLTGISNFNTIQ